MVVLVVRRPLRADRLGRLVGFPDAGLDFERVLVGGPLVVGGLVLVVKEVLLLGGDDAVRLAVVEVGPDVEPVAVRAVADVRQIFRPVLVDSAQATSRSQLLQM